MFNNMKNKIKEKTGTEIPKFAASAGTLFSKRSNQHSRQSSQGSIHSAFSEASIKEDRDNKNILKTMNQSSSSNDSTSIKEDDTINWEAKYNEKEREWREKEKLYVADLLKQTKELQETISLVEENKKKYHCCLEEKQQLEQYQKEEVSRIKQLLLSKEEENNANLTTLKEYASTIELLKQEVSRLRPLEERINTCEDDLECLRHTSEREIWNLTSQLAQKEEQNRHLEERVSVLTHRTEADCQALGAQLSTDERVRSLIAERALLERRLEEAHIHLSEIKTSWSNKIAILETQVGRLSRQAGEESVERRNAENRIVEMEQRVLESNKENQKLHSKLDMIAKERDSLANELKHMIADVTDKTTADIDTDALRTLEDKVEILSKENAALKESNEETQRILNESLTKEIEKNNRLNIELIKLKDSTQELESSVKTEKDAKDKMLLRNAEVSQRIQLAEKDLQEQLSQNDELYKRMATLEKSLETVQLELKEEHKMNISKIETEMYETIKKLENEISEKNNSIRLLQQNLTDLKKTVQYELQNSINNSTGNLQNNNKNEAKFEDDINFKYMKHVLVKFLTSSEYEAQHLTKAVAMLLRLNPEEEKLIRDTLEWRKTSWFGSRPRMKLQQNHI